MARLPSWSMAALPIQRKLASGAYVPCWYRAGVVLTLRSSYQRTATLVPAVTEWFTTSDSEVPKLRYASRYISRSARESSCWVVFSCGIHVPPPPQAALKAATEIAVGPVNVEFAGVVQST